MEKYNLLTRELLAAGFDENNHPKYVKVAGGRVGKENALYNIYGGFEYLRIYTDKFVYKTGCGMYVQGIHVLDDISCGGDHHCHENNNPVIRCPYLKKGCKDNYNKVLANEIYGGGLCAQLWCECHRTEETYDYNKSIEKANEDRNEERERLYKEFAQKHNGRVCRNHCFFNEHTGEWSFDYNPKRCATYCPKMYTYCDVLGKPLSRKKGNVFYDVKKEFDVKLNEGDQIGLFDKSHYVEIVKGFKVFKKPISIDICEAYAKVGKNEILSNYEVNHSYERFWNKTITFEVMNIRAEIKETRDLFQDLEDIKNGIVISHESDNIAAKKDLKRERAEKAKDAKKKKFTKEIRARGWNALDQTEKKNALKVLEDYEIKEADGVFQEPKEEQKEKQISIFDFIGGE